MGPEQLYLEDVTAGYKTPEWDSGEVTRTQIARFAGATGDFNPIHCDETFAHAAGYPSVFAHGMLTAGMLSHYLTDLVGIGNVRRFGYRFLAQVWPGDSLQFSGVVQRCYTEGDEPRVDCTFEVRRADGAVVVTGTATATLPSRN